jgi:glucose-6-phosphate isomerase
MDTHFRSAPLEQNMPVILALLGVWYNNFHGVATQAMLPYDQTLEYFVSYFSRPTWRATASTWIVTALRWTTRPARVVGRYRYQRPACVFPADTPGHADGPGGFHRGGAELYPLGEHHAALLSNFFAQTEALMRGKTEAEVRAELQAAGLDAKAIEALLPHKVFKGNKPTNSILFEKLTPRTLGKLIALYEHKIFVQGIVWNINSFDQWGVELGKQLATHLQPELRSGAEISTDERTILQPTV